MWLAWTRLRRPLLRFLLVAAAANALDDQCKDPLFESHWAGKVGYATMPGHHTEEMSSIPVVETHLAMCTQFNGKATCCNRAFEQEQIKYFNFYRDMIFPSKLERIAAQRQSVKDVMNTAAYSAATRVEREQLSLAIERFNAVLHPSVNGPCISELLTYVAGMNCFACRPDWFAFVTQSEKHVGDVLRVHIHASVCMGLWSACEVFGEAAVKLKQALLDSSLAKQAKKETENLEMFSDQQTLCDWLHDAVALHPFRRPTTAEREAANQHRSSGGKEDQAVEPQAKGFLPEPSATERRLQGVEQLRDGQGEIDVLAEGRASQFKTQWGDSAGGGRAGLPLWVFALVLTWGVI